MNSKNKVILMLGFAFLSILLLAFSASPVMAKSNGPGGKAPRVAAHNGPAMVSHGHSSPDRRGHEAQPSRWNDGHHDSRSRLGISFGFGSYFYPTTYSRWVPGYYQIRTEEVLVEPAHYEWQTQQVQVEPGRYEVRHIPAVDEIRRDEQGKEYKVVIQPARTETVWIPPRYEQREVKVWVADRYETRQMQVCIPGYWVSEPAYGPSRSWLNLGGAFRF